MTEIDIGIITHNRDRELLRCVSYILSNSKLPKTIIIAHSQPESKCGSKQSIVRLCERVDVDLKYIHVPHRGISYSRNRVIKEVRSPIFGFIDDDEFPSQDWISFASTFFSKHSQIDVLSGPKIPSNLSNYWNRLWFEIYRESLNSIGPADFVTSGNSFFKTSFIKKNNILFDEKFTDSSEDEVFSHLLLKHDARMVFHKDLLEFHDFRDNMIGFLKQWHGYGKSSAGFEKKYHLLKPQSYLQKLIQLLQGRKLFTLRKPQLWFGFILMDISFSLGFITGLLDHD